MHEALLAINSDANAPRLRLDCYRNRQVFRRRAARPPQSSLRMRLSLGAAAVLALALLPAPAAAAGPPATTKRARPAANDKEGGVDLLRGDRGPRAGVPRPPGRGAARRARPRHPHPEPQVP